MSTIRSRDKRTLNPSSRLTSDSNVATPLLLSHRQSIAHAQAQKAHATKEAETANPNPAATTDLAGPSVPLARVTPTSTQSPATSQPGSAQPTSAIPSESENETNDQSTTAAGKGEIKRKRHDIIGEFQDHCDSASAQRSTDKDGMYQDVVVLDIDSDLTDPENKNKNKNPKADIDHFFEPAKHVKGDKKGRRLCKTCLYEI
jgi:hypothetical protein